LGVGTFPDDAQSPEALIARADEAMYLVKQGRRNGVLGATPPSLPAVRPVETAAPPVESEALRNGRSSVGVSSEP
jgi:hypothetical protein